MKYLEIILVILAAALIRQNEGKPSTALNELKGRMNDTIEFLNHYKSSLPVEGNNDIEFFLNDEKENILRIGNKAFVTIELEAENATNAGHNVEECSKSAQSSIHRAQSKCLPALDECSRDNKIKWSLFETLIHILILNGEGILNKFNGIDKKCYHDSYNPERCIASQLPGAESDLKEYETSVEQIKMGSLMLIDYALSKMKACISPFLPIYETEVSNAVRIASDCIKSAQAVN